MKAIIFGANSQDGYYLTGLCKQRQIEVIGISRSKGDWKQADITDKPFVTNLIKSLRPDYIFHLAANSTTRHEALFENYATICKGALNLFEAVKIHIPTCKIFITGSGLQFENTGLPIKETDSFEANSAYSLARIQAVYISRYYRSLGLKSYVGYLFHHESPFRKSTHISKFTTDAIKRIIKGNKEVIELGDISVKKEWAFAKDITAGIFTLVDQDQIFEAAIGTGKAYSIQDWLEECFGLAGLDWKDHVRLKEQFVSEYKVLVSDPSTINSLGWNADTSFIQLAKIMMNET